MNRRPILLALAFLLVGCSVTGAAGWKAGVAKVKITPAGPVWMSGYASRNRPCTQKLTDIWAKALAIQDSDGNKAVFLTADLIGIDRPTSQAVCRQIEKTLGIKRHQIAICTSHTHTGPAIGLNLPAAHYLLLKKQEQEAILAYTRTLQDNMVKVVAMAVGKMAPVDLTWGSGRATFAVNRRNNRPESKVPELRKAGKLRGPVDHDVPVMAVRRDGKLIATLFGYACHATTMSFYKWSGDYPGFAQIELEKKHPGSIALFWAGCGADQNPLPRRTVELAKQYGKRLAVAVDAVLSSKKMKVIQADLATNYAEVPLPLDKLPTISDLNKQAESKNRYIKARAKMLLEQIANGKPLAQTYPYPISVWKLGKEIQFVALGGEVVVDFAIRLKAEMRGVKTWVSGYSNDVMAYIASRRVLREGGYEGETAMIYYGLPTKWAMASEEIIVKEVRRQAK